MELSSSVRTANGTPIPFSSRYFAPIRPTPADVSDDELRIRYRVDGYVLVRGVLPCDLVTALRDAYVQLYEAARRLGPLPRHGAPGHPAYDFVRSSVFRAFVTQPRLRELAERLVGAPVVPIRRTPLRHFRPEAPVASRAHVDQTYIDGSPAEMVTIWTPLGPCPIAAGGLMYLEDSHADPSLEGRLRRSAPRDRAHDDRPITHDLKWLAEFTHKRWRVADFQAGDVAIHSPRVVHATLDPMEVRLSVDIRFARADRPLDGRWVGDWSADDGY